MRCAYPFEMPQVAAAGTLISNSNLILLAFRCNRCNRVKVRNETAAASAIDGGFLWLPAMEMEMETSLWGMQPVIR